MAFRNAVLQAQYCELDEYGALAADVATCTAPEEIAAAWTLHADRLAERLPADVIAFALAWCGSQVTRLDPTLKQGTAWLKKRIAELGGTPPEKPTRGPNGRNAHSDPTPSANGSGEASAPVADAAQASADPERDAIQSEGAVDLATRWDAGEVTPETWRAHLAAADNEHEVGASHAKHSHRFGRAAESSPYRGVTLGRLRELGLSDMAASVAIDSAMKARTAKAEKVAA